MQGEYVISKKINDECTGLLGDNIWSAKLNIDNGVILSYVSKDKDNVVVDSLSNSNDIWKVNYKFQKNNGYLIFQNPEEFFPSRPQFDDKYQRPCGVKRNFISYYNPLKTEIQFGESYRGLIEIGGVHNYNYQEEHRDGTATEKLKYFDNGGKKLGLDNNGIYSDHLFSFDRVNSFTAKKVDINKVPAFDKLILFDYSEGNFDQYRSKENNLLVTIYNYLINNHELINKEFIDINEGRIGLPGFVSALQDTSLYSNSFSKYIKIPKTPNGYFSLDDLSKEPYNLTIKKTTRRPYYKLGYFFNEVISITNYLKACFESIQNNGTEIQYLMIWNRESDKWDKVDFENLIKIAEKKENEISEFASKKTLSYFGLKSIDDWEKLRRGMVSLDNKWFSETKYSIIKDVLLTYESEKDIIDLKRDSIITSSLELREILFHKAKIAEKYYNQIEKYYQITKSLKDSVNQHILKNNLVEFLIYPNRTCGGREDITSSKYSNMGFTEKMFHLQSSINRNFLDNHDYYGMSTDELVSFLIDLNKNFISLGNTKIKKIDLSDDINKLKELNDSINFIHGRLISKPGYVNLDLDTNEYNALFNKLESYTQQINTSNKVDLITLVELLKSALPIFSDINSDFNEITENNSLKNTDFNKSYKSIFSFLIDDINDGFIIYEIDTKISAIQNFNNEIKVYLENISTLGVELSIVISSTDISKKLFDIYFISLNDIFKYRETDSSALLKDLNDCAINSQDFIKSIKSFSKNDYLLNSLSSNKKLSTIIEKYKIIRSSDSNYQNKNSFDRLIKIQYNIITLTESNKKIIKNLVKEISQINDSSELQKIINKYNSIVLNNH